MFDQASFSWPDSRKRKCYQNMRLIKNSNNYYFNVLNYEQFSNNCYICFYSKILGGEFSLSDYHKKWNW